MNTEREALDLAKKVLIEVVEADEQAIAELNHIGQTVAEPAVTAKCRHAIASILSALANKPETAALQKRIEKLEAALEKIDEIESSAKILGRLDERYKGTAYTEQDYAVASSCISNISKCRKLIRALKAGDVQAPKESLEQAIREVAASWYNSEQKWPACASLRELGIKFGVDIRLAELMYNKPAAPTDTEGK